MDMEKLFSLGDDLINVLKDKKDGDNLMQSLEEARVLGSFFDVNTREINISLEEYERRIHRCKERIDETKQEAFSDSELDNLQTQLEKKVKTENLLRQELGEVSDELVGLEHQRISIESRWQLVKQREKDAQKSQDSLSLCASATGIIPDLCETTKVSGYIVDSSKKKIDKFELDSEMPAFEVCNSLWKMASKF